MKYSSDHICIACIIGNKYGFSCEIDRGTAEVFDEKTKPFTMIIGWQSKEITKEYMRKKLNVSLSTLDRRIAQYRKTGE